MPFPVMPLLLVKLGEPRDSTLCVVEPVPVQVQVTAWPTGTVSTAGLVVPLCALWKKRLPTVTAPTAPPPAPLPPPLPPLPPLLGLVLLEHPSAAAAAAGSSQVRKILMESSPSIMLRRLARAARLAHLICYNRSRQDICSNRYAVHVIPDLQLGSVSPCAELKVRDDVDRIPVTTDVL